MLSRGRILLWVRRRWNACANKRAICNILHNSTMPQCCQYPFRHSLPSEVGQRLTEQEIRPDQGRLMNLLWCSGDMYNVGHSHEWPAVMLWWWTSNIVMLALNETSRRIKQTRTRMDEVKLTYLLLFKLAYSVLLQLNFCPLAENSKMLIRIPL